MRTLAIAAAIGLVVASGPASAMPVQDFLKTADALQARGYLAMFSPDLGLLKKEIGSDAAAWRAQLQTARPPVCAPPAVNMTSDGIVKMIQAVPPAQRATTSTQAAFIEAMNSRYRCAGPTHSSAR